jgi:hypothetical protein
VASVYVGTSLISTSHYSTWQETYVQTRIFYILNAKVSLSLFFIAGIQYQLDTPLMTAAAAVLLCTFLAYACKSSLQIVILCKL